MFILLICKVFFLKVENQAVASLNLCRVHLYRTYEPIQIGAIEMEPAHTGSIFF